jgi:hypothetical protein
MYVKKLPAVLFSSVGTNIAGHLNDPSRGQRPLASVLRL